ncbi:unnamed protein product [Periconia digitata]|uniref:Uncharacterized protein n=1 Tax=Periconia digitata TaxID=1303443 RepID=A0A9W4UE95_9PLEO|nr:unnamed protein product [Periconia digitata]
MCLSTIQRLWSCDCDTCLVRRFATTAILLGSPWQVPCCPQRIVLCLRKRRGVFWHHPTSFEVCNLPLSIQENRTSRLWRRHPSVHP